MKQIEMKLERKTERNKVILACMQMMLMELESKASLIQANRKLEGG
jgi:hypothetical protein